MHKPIQFKNLSLLFPHKTCFTDFSGQILYGSRIAIIGRNGVGKSTLLNMLRGLEVPHDGELILPQDLQIGYLPQVVEAFSSFSGGERLNRALTEALTNDPNLLLLDEPTNHLDKTNRRSLMRMLRNYQGTLILVSHDVELLRSTVDTFWHIHHGEIHVFSGDYDDYQDEILRKQAILLETVAALNKQKKENHAALMQEQQRAKKSRLRGEKHIEKRKWPTVRSASKVLHAVETTGLKKREMKAQKEVIMAHLTTLYVPETIQVKFSLSSQSTASAVLTIRDGSVGYGETQVMTDIHLSIHAYERVAVSGDNGSGKSMLMRAILNEQAIKKHGDWHGPRADEIGYLDQHYQTLNAQQTVLETIKSAMPNTAHTDIRKHLNDFLFRKNEEVEATVSSLSGGEKARLSLGLIAAKPPKLLILDEVTNNLDLETRAHVIQVLLAYSGAMIVISHDADFLKSIQIDSFYRVLDGRIEADQDFVGGLS